jgi:YD repeat-containing protein
VWFFGLYLLRRVNTATSGSNVIYNANFSIDHNNYVLPGSSDGVSGKECLYLWTAVSPGSAVALTGTQMLQLGKEYILSFWNKGSVPAVSIGGIGITVPAAVAAKGNWSNYIIRFTPTTSSAVKITGTSANCYLDEVRLFPSNASMTSWTYEPLFGKSSETGANGRITYYEYDKLGRPTIVRDQDGNILSKTDIIIQGNE